MFGTHLGPNHTKTTKNTHLESPLVLSLEPNRHSAHNQKNKVESWRLFISNRAARACVIDARQTMHVSGAGAWERGDGFQMREVFAFIVFCCQRVCRIFDGAGAGREEGRRGGDSAVQYLEQVNKLLHLTWDLSWDRCVQMCCVQGR